MSRRRTIWDWSYIALLIISIPAAAFHFSQGRYGQTLIALGALSVGVFILAKRPGAEFSITPPMADVERSRSRTEGVTVVPPTVAKPERVGRLADWLPLGIISGFAATGVVTLVLVLAHGTAGFLGSTEATAPVIRQWFQGLVYNPLTQTTHANLAAALALHFIAGIGWAILYAAVFEPRLRGLGWKRGALFSVIPWLFSVFVFLPMTGAGIIGLNLGAGPLPALGNLILHLVYGVTLGQVYASTRLLTETGFTDDQAEEAALARTQRVMAASLVPGMVVGAVTGLIGSSVLAPGNQPALVAVFGAVLGCVCGILLGSFLGLTPLERSRG